MVQPAIARAHSSAHAGTPSQRNRTGLVGGLHALSVHMAARVSGHTTARRGWNASDHQATPGIRDLRGGVGVRGPEASHIALHAGPARPPVSFGRSDVGPAFASPVA